MYSQGDLFNEIRRVIEDEGAKKDIASDWLVHRILSARPLPTKGFHADDREFHRLCAYNFVRDCVADVVRELKHASTKRTKAANRQLELPGFRHLQTFYMFERRGRSVIVSLDRMTYAELMEKAREHEKAEGGHREHKVELIRFAREKFGNHGDERESV
jgi:hypothetical protein